VSSIAWGQVFQPNTTRWVKSPSWHQRIDLGPVVSFKIVPIAGQLAVAQAYPVGTGNKVSDKVEWVMDHAKGPFRFGVETLPDGNRLLVELSLSSDMDAFQAQLREPAKP
jgi:hypothetical protein